MFDGYSGELPLWQGELHFSASSRGDHRPDALTGIPGSTDCRVRDIHPRFGSISGPNVSVLVSLFHLSEVSLL